jgi:hypothetical protein
MTASLPTLRRRALYRGRKGRRAKRRLVEWFATAKMINRINDRLRETMLASGPPFFVLPDHLPES